jgi:hypothetical protein
MRFAATCVTRQPRRPASGLRCWPLTASAAAAAAASAAAATAVQITSPATPVAHAASQEVLADVLRRDLYDASAEAARLRAEVLSAQQQIASYAAVSEERAAELREMDAQACCSPLRVPHCEEGGCYCNLAVAGLSSCPDTSKVMGQAMALPMILSITMQAALCNSLPA